MAALAAAACGSNPDGGSSIERPETPTSAATADSGQLALDAARRRLDILLAGDIEPKPFVLDWGDVQAGTLLTSAQNESFCRSLDTPGSDDALARLVGLGLNSLSLRLRRKPLPDEADDVLGIAAKFAVTACPAWVPIVNPPARAVPTPAPSWHEAGFSRVIGDPNLVWRWSAKESFKCAEGVRWCWQIDVVARYGCDQLEGVLAVKNAQGAVLEFQTASIPSVSPELRVPIGFGSNQPAAASAELPHLTCT